MNLSLEPIALAPKSYQDFCYAPLGMVNLHRFPAVSLLLTLAQLLNDNFVSHGASPSGPSRLSRLHGPPLTWKVSTAELVPEVSRASSERQSFLKSLSTNPSTQRTVAVPSRPSSDCPVFSVTAISHLPRGKTISTFPDLKLGYRFIYFCLFCKCGRYSLSTASKHGC